MWKHDVNEEEEKLALWIVLLFFFQPCISITLTIYFQFECSTCSSKTKTHCCEVILAPPPFYWLCQKKITFYVNLEFVTVSCDLISVLLLQLRTVMCLQGSSYPSELLIRFSFVDSIDFSTQRKYRLLRFVYFYSLICNSFFFFFQLISTS